MAGKDTPKKIAALGSLCGITSQYWDNFGRRHRTSQATYRDLLSAMGVPWEDPEGLDREIARRRLGPWGAMLEPVQLIKPAPAQAGATVRVWSPGPEPPAAVDVFGEMVSETGERLPVGDRRLKVAGRLKSQAVPGGFRVAVRLPLPADLELGYYDLTLKVRSGGREESGRTRLIAAPPQAYAPAWLEEGRRAWGFNLPLYALRSRANWGVGDFADLMEVIRWAGPLGAAFVGVNPLHAAGGRATADPSPYSPTSRIFLNVLYLSLEAAPEMAACRKAQDLVASPEFQAAKARLAAAALVSYGEVHRLKRRVLKLLYQTFCEVHGAPEGPPRSARGQEFARFVAAGGESLARFGQFSALADHLQQGDWRRWPEPYQHPESPAVAEFAREHAEGGRVLPVWAMAGRDPTGPGVPGGSKTGPAVHPLRGPGPGGEPRGLRHLGPPGALCPGPGHRRPSRRLQSPGAELGAAAPDPGTPAGLGLPVVHRHPPGQPPARRHAPDGPRHGTVSPVVDSPGGWRRRRGAYVTYPARELLAILALESVRRRALIIGEDLGTVPPRIRRELGKSGVFSYRVFYFERDAQWPLPAPGGVPGPGHGHGDHP